MDRLEQLAQPGAMFGTDAYPLGPVDEDELALQQRLRLLPLIIALAVPFVDRDHQRAAGIERIAQHTRVLVGHAFAGIEHDHRDLAMFDRLQGLDDRELLDHLLHPRLAAHAGGVDQPVQTAIAFHVDGDRVARGARHLRGDHPLLAEQAVDQGRLADVRTAYEGDTDTRGVGVELRRRALFGQLFEDLLQQRVDALAVRRRDRDDVLEAVARELVQCGLRVDAVGLVDDQHRRPRGPAQPREDVVVHGRGAFAAIDDEQHEVGLLGRRARLARGGAGQALVDAGDTAGVDHGERTHALGAADAVVAVAGDTGLVVDQGIAAARQRIEQRGFSDVGTTNERDKRKHGEPTQSRKNDPGRNRGWAGQDLCCRSAGADTAKYY